MRLAWKYGNFDSGLLSVKSQYCWVAQLLLFCILSRSVFCVANCSMLWLSVVRVSSPSDGFGSVFWIVRVWWDGGLLCCCLLFLKIEIVSILKLIQYSYEQSSYLYHFIRTLMLWCGNNNNWICHNRFTWNWSPKTASSIEYTSLQYSIIKLHSIFVLII